MLAVVMSGGYGYTDSAGEILQAMSALRRGMALDLVERLATDARVRCVVVTDDQELVHGVQALGAGVVWTGWASESSGSGDFEFGVGLGFDWLRALHEAVRRFGGDSEEAVLVVGGCGAPFLTEQGVRALVEIDGRGVWQNNRMSPDIVLVRPGAAVFAVQVCRNDNEFGFALESQAGLPVHYFPPELGLFFDVDTPLDALLAATHPAAGERLRVTSTFLPQRVGLEQLLAVLRRTDYPDIALLGRVHPVEAEKFGQALGLRIRVFSEERGMKALGRVEKGLVRSLIATLLDARGEEAFFAELGGMASAVLWDTRVLFAHKGLELSDHDRFAADLGLVEQIRDPFLRRFTQAAQTAGFPVLTGGQALVSGALRLLRESTKVEI
ncbi:hypothetical protein [Tumebacillus permanentifrigoris]|uniref:Uncharacterized protein n=1 Tax=Tumebacillus permanentifrigoris TaxID=378543 RepID=A0A316D7V9_9BACL|nr:hypothetical protein [Tumebacillus permanentifrigoris]PWK05718.1 hypothetical protein C7459_12285 [Tumebacillus permanentifrigoris]